LSANSDRLFLVDPVGYFEIISLLESSILVMTDSGGIQKEAYFFQKPCITLRGETEWVELVEAGVNHLVEIENDKTLQMVRKVLKGDFDFSGELYGQGDAAKKVLECLVKSR